MFEEEHSRHRIEVAELAGMLAGIQAQMEKDLAARDGRIAELEARIAELEAQVEEVIEEKDAVERKVVVMAQVMEEEQSRHRIEVAELEGIQEQMLKELSEKDAKVAVLEEEAVALTAAVAVEQNARAQAETQQRAKLERQLATAQEYTHVVKRCALEVAGATEGELSRREQMTQEMKAHLAQAWAQGETYLSSTEESVAETKDKKVALATQRES